MSGRTATITVLIAAALLVPVSGAAPLARSGPGQVALLEVYSSEGCSSCPPAEEWLTRLSTRPGLWTEVVPVVFHVDYWDALGWTDPLSARRFTERQQAQASAWGGEGGVYTPGFVLNGQEWRDWHRHDTARTATPRPTGILTIEQTGQGRFTVTFQPQAGGPPASSYTVHAALLGCGLVSNVTAGENAGRRLTHDFAVIDDAEETLQPAGDGRFTRDITFSRPSTLTPPRRAIAAWVSPIGHLEPLQAAGAYL